MHNEFIYVLNRIIFKIKYSKPPSPHQVQKTYKHRYKLKCTFVALLLGVWGRHGWAGSLADADFGAVLNT